MQWMLFLWMCLLGASCSGKGAASSGSSTGPWECSSDLRADDQTCDCGCGSIDPDCGIFGCSESGCNALGCQRCWDNGNAITCGAPPTDGGITSSSSGAASTGSGGHASHGMGGSASHGGASGSNGGASGSGGGGGSSSGAAGTSVASGVNHPPSSSASSGMPPTVTVRILTIKTTVINGTTYPEIHLADHIALGAQGQAAPGRSIRGYQWRVAQSPVSQNTAFSSPTANMTLLQFSTSAGPRTGLPAVGAYQICVKAVDDANIPSEDACVSFNAVNDKQLHVELTWDGTADLDLHLTGGTADVFSMGDCNFLNCRTGLDWGGGALNPRLDVDNTQAYGPENIDIQSPAPNVYHPGVHFYHGSGMQHATVRVYQLGTLLGEYSHTFTACNQFWTAADIHWETTPPSSLANNMTSTRGEGSCP